MIHKCCFQIHYFYNFHNQHPDKCWAYKSVAVQFHLVHVNKQHTKGKKILGIESVIFGNFVHHMMGKSTKTYKLVPLITCF